MRSPFRYFNGLAAVICTAVLLFIRFPLSRRQVVDLLHERGIDISQETVLFWCNRFGWGGRSRVSYYAAEERTAAPPMRWHLDEAFLRVNGEPCYRWWGVDHEGEVLEVYVTKTGDCRAALDFLKRTLKRLDSPRSVVTDRLRSYRAVLWDLGNTVRQDTARWLNSRAEDVRRPFRQRERSIQRFRSDDMLRKFVSIPAAIHNHFNLDRYLTRRTDLRQRRDVGLAEWRHLAIRLRAYLLLQRQG